MGYAIRRAGPEDRGHVEALLAEVFASAGPGEIRARYDWLHVDNPHGRSLVWLAVDDSGEIAGCATYFRRSIVAHGRPVKAALGGDCWVRPKFRRRGIAAALHGQGRREMPDEGIEVMFGTPTHANETPLIQNGARNIGFATRFARPLRVAKVPLSGLVLSRGWGDARLASAEGVDPRIDEVWERVRHEIGIGTVRDAVFYDWRFGRAPSRLQRPFVIRRGDRPIGACALEVDGTYLRVVDLLALREHWGDAIGALVRHAKAEHPACATLSFRLVEEEAAARHVWRWGCVARNRGVFNVLLPEGEPRAEVFYDPTRWFLTWADSDVDRA